jgi:hypothetical protein
MHLASNSLKALTGKFMSAHMQIADSDLSETVTSSEHAAPAATLKQRFFLISFLTAVAAAMVGWLWAIGWVTLAAAKWLLA